MDNTYDIGSSSYRVRQVYAASSVISTSDEREKENIKALTEDITAFFMSLKPIEYSFKDYGFRTHWGRIAQEVEEAIYANGMNSLDFAGLCISPVTKEIDTGKIVLTASPFSSASVAISTKVL